MANCCEYQLKAVSKDVNALRRLYEIMEYKDPEWYIYRVQYAEMPDDPMPEGDGGLYSVCIYGDVAWATDRWFGDVTTTEKADNGATYTNLVELCKKLGIAVEVWAREEGMGFQSHTVCNEKGELYCDSVDWNVEVDKGKVVGEDGGYEEFGQFVAADELYGGSPEELVKETT